ncbi:MAG: T9SS type A sorting domain-containing protein [Reichenbachiella sp.]
MEKMLRSALLLLTLFLSHLTNGQNSVAREWSEALLEAIRIDYARPTVHARNLFHTSTAMYEAWAAYDDIAAQYLLGKTVNRHFVVFNDFTRSSDIELARNEAISFAAYRVLTYRFKNSPGQPETQVHFDQLMSDLGYDRNFKSIFYEDGNPAALGNYIGQAIIDYGNNDHSNEANDYANEFYTPVNVAMNPRAPGNPNLSDPNRWQPLAFNFFIDQSGHQIPGLIPSFLGPEWGSVYPFALNQNDLHVYQRNGEDYYVYHDPSAPPYLDQEQLTEESKAYQWGNALVSAWSGHLDPTDNVMIDISPNSIGNNPEFPESYLDYPDFYDLENGGDQSRGYPINPVTGLPYETQSVPRGDYGRVLAEFWADGPASETPPGHWFTILNYVSDHELLVKKFKGEGDVLNDLEWDIKSYFALAGAMHDAAVAAWGAKGWYDYIRPVSAIRYMADKGQSTNKSLSNYQIEGIPLVEGYIEVIETGDPMAGAKEENVGKIKLFAWQGHGVALNNPDFNSETDAIGVDWILAENWWPYQRVSFVTPPFAGYVSGHSTFSRAAAEVMTMLTGDEYFPGGMGEFDAPMNEFLVFEEGPSMDVTLQWATYRDASDQCSLSRIWGGIHPPADDIPGRKMGIEIGRDAFNLAEDYFNDTVLSARNLDISPFQLYPNPISSDKILKISNVSRHDNIMILNLQGQVLKFIDTPVQGIGQEFNLNVQDLESGIYILRINQSSQKFIISSM